MRTEIAWAGGFSAAGGATPTKLLGPPDGHAYIIGIGDNTFVTVRDFQPISYAGIADLLATAVHGDVVTPAMLEISDFIAFEHNGDHPAPSGGWESCDWRFSDGVETVAFHWDQATVDGQIGSQPVARDPHVVANGSITGAAYAGFFGIPEVTILQENPAGGTLEGVVISFLLFRLRSEINLQSADLGVTLSVSGATPDVDALGVLTHLPTALTYPRFDNCPG